MSNPLNRIGPGLSEDADAREAVELRLRSWHVGDLDRGRRDLVDLSRHAPSPTAFLELLERLHPHLARSPDPGRVLTNLERFVAAGLDPRACLARLAQGGRTVEVVAQLFGASQFFAEILIREPTWLTWLLSGAERRDRRTLIDDLWSELKDAPDDEAGRLTLRRFRLREFLRIGYNDIVREFPLEVTTLDLSHLADACVEAAYRISMGHALARYGEPRGGGGKPARFVVLALGKLGGEELNYSSDIDLIFLYDSEGRASGEKGISNAEFFARTGGEIVRLLSDHTSLGQAYRVDMRLRPEGDQGPLARSLASTLGYYETSGRTWERQALIKCRPIAGDLELGRDFLAAATPFVYRRYLGAAEIGEIKAMKRRIEQRTLSEGADEVEVKTGRGGIRDVEFVVQFLQLLHGGGAPEVRHQSTLTSMARLEDAGCLTAEERGVMEDTYRFLRRLEHRLQTMFDRQTHRMPRDPEELRALAIRMGYSPASAWESWSGPTERFLRDYRAKTDLNRRILNHLLHDAFRDDAGTQVDPAVDLVLDPAPTSESIERTLAPYPFRDKLTAYKSLMALSREEIPFLSQARCRHFLAAIAPDLLRALAGAPDADMALTNLEKVSASLGAKAVLWELFSVNPPTLRLFVELCATSQFLSEVLINNPGMIDDLMDSLVADRPRTATEILEELTELCRGAEDLAPILLSFRNKEWVRIGSRDILGREPVRVATRELADVASAIVNAIARDQEARAIARLGTPRHATENRRDGWAIVGFGKLGGRELNYHGDLDLVFLYESEGRTKPARGRDPVSNARFFLELARRIIKTLSSEDLGPLYSVDTRLRPHGASGPLTTTLDSFRFYYRDAARTWERLALMRSRVLFASGPFGRKVSQTIREIAMLPVDSSRLAEEVGAMRKKLEAGRGGTDLKRGPGGSVDIEFLTQYLQLAHCRERPEILRPNVWEALAALKRAGILDRDDYDELTAAYDFLRSVEGRLRLVYNRAMTELPEDETELARLARRLNYASTDPQTLVESFRNHAERIASRTRSIFDAYLKGARS